MININTSRTKISFILFALFIFLFTCPGHSGTVGHSILSEYIIKYNIDAIEKSLEDNSYRGEEGILRLKPEVAESLGIKAFTDQDYLDSKKLFQEAEEALGKARNAMADKKERASGYYTEKIVDNFLLYKSTLEQAEKKLMNYRSKLGPEIDERFDNSICESILQDILEKSFDKTDNLRDGLADFYNTCQGIDDKVYPLTTKNVRFVNYVFNAFLEQAPKEEIEMFDLDRDDGRRNGSSSDNWKEAAGKDISEFAALLEKAIQKIAEEIYAVDPLLFISLIKKESDFNPLAVSGVGAAGLTQIMPATAKDLGLENIHVPQYYNEAVDLLKKEREARRSAVKALFKITEETGLEYAKQARELMQESLELGSKRADLYNRYKKDLQETKTDSRLDPAMAIEYGLKYFARQMKTQEGDISLALASYNAGPQRVKEYNGIPPFEETVGFRNRILKYYYDYLLKTEER